MTNALLTSLIYYLPSDDIDVADELSGQPIPSLPDTTVNRPWIVVSFSRSIDPASYASPDTWAQLFLLTNLTSPSATNTTQFTDFAWDTQSIALRFRPSNDLIPGDQYAAFLSGKLRDGEQRCIKHSYSWTFTVGPSIYSTQEGDSSPLTAVQLLSPADASVVLTSPTLTWSQETNPTPVGSSITYLVRVAKDRAMSNVLWQSLVTPTS